MPKAGSTTIGDTGADEIGDVAKAVKFFRDAGIEKLRLEREAQEQHTAAAEERMRNEQARDAAAQQVEMLVRMLGPAPSGIAEGDLQVRPTDQCAPEYSKVKEDFNAALTTLQETITAISSTAQEVSNTSAEISASTTDLSQRTEEQAANLEETSFSLERIPRSSARTPSVRTRPASSPPRRAPSPTAAARSSPRPWAPCRASKRTRARSPTSST